MRYGSCSRAGTRASTWTLGLWLLLTPACERSERVRCSLGEATRVTRSTAARFDAVALASDGTRALAAWSDPSGTWLEWLEPRAAAPLRRGERCEGGLALLLEPGAAWLACLTPPRGTEPGSVSVTRLEGEALEPGVRHQLARELGRDAHGIALARASASLFVAWEDGALGDPKVMLASVPPGASPDSAPRVRALSRPHGNGHEPSLWMYQGELWAAWTESDLTLGKTRHRVMLQRGERAPALLVQTSGESPSPALASDAEGMVIAYRATRRPGARAELWLARIDPAGARFLAPARAVGRANGAGGPSLALCRTTRAAAVPIDHAGELYVAFHPLSYALQGTEENHQYYESGRELVFAASVCVGEHPRVLLAEQTDPVRPAARLLSTEFRCTGLEAPAGTERLISSAGGLPTNPGTTPRPPQ